MSPSRKKLIADTLRYLKEQPFFEAPLAWQTTASVTPAPPKPAPPKLPPAPKPPIKATPTPIAQESKAPNLSLLEKHLPHIKIKQAPLTPPTEVVILATRKEDLPFLQGLAQAIQARFCKVRLLDTHVLDAQKSWDTLFASASSWLILSQRTDLPPCVPPERVILLASIETYQNNTQIKQALWSSLCQSLSTPKSP